MLIDLQEFRTGALKTARLNRTLNVIEGTVLITPTSQNGPRGKRRYSEAALAQIAAMSEGLPAYANHVAPELAFKPRDVRDLIGRHQNVRYDAATGTVKSDLHVLEHHVPWVFGLAERLGDVVGNSLVSRGAVTMEGDTEVVTEIALLRSADLVSDPASTKGLFESLDVWPPSLAPQPRLRPHPHARLRAALLGQAFVTLEEMADAHRATPPRPAPPRDTYTTLTEAQQEAARFRLWSLAEHRDVAEPPPAGAHARLIAAFTS
jgi:hypothetical protein